MIIPDRAPSEEQFWLLAYLTAFLQSLNAQGYSKYTIEVYRRISHRLCDVVHVNNIGPSELDMETMDKLAADCLTTDSSRMKKQIETVVHRFTEYLIAGGVIIVRKDPLPSPGTIEHLCMELNHWLRTQRGLSGDHLRVYPNILTQFVQHCNAGTDMVQNLALVTPEDIISFVDKVTVASTWRIPYLRNILRFLFWRNYNPQDLSAIIPPTAKARTDGLPRHLEQTTVNRLLNAIQNDTPRDRQDYAMLLLMAALWTPRAGTTSVCKTTSSIYSVVFEAENDQLDPEKVVGLARHLRPTLSKLSTDCYPVFSYMTPEEIEFATA